MLVWEHLFFRQCFSFLAEFSLRHVDLDYEPAPKISNIRSSASEWLSLTSPTSESICLSVTACTETPGTDGNLSSATLSSAMLNRATLNRLRREVTDVFNVIWSIFRLYERPHNDASSIGHRRFSLCIEGDKF